MFAAFNISTACFKFYHSHSNLVQILMFPFPFTGNASTINVSQLISFNETLAYFQRTNMQPYLVSEFLIMN